MGLPTRYDLEGKDKNFLKPIEDIEEGCPGGWYRCGFIRSIHKYRRSGIENRIENILLKRSRDKLILEAIDYLENQEIQSHNDFMEVRNSD